MTKEQYLAKKLSEEPVTPFTEKLHQERMSDDQIACNDTTITREMFVRIIGIIKPNYGAFA